MSLSLPATAWPYRSVVFRPTPPPASTCGKLDRNGEAETMAPIMMAPAFAAGFAAQLVKLPPLTDFLAAGFIVNALGFANGAALDTSGHPGVTLLRGEVWGSATLHIVGSTRPP